MPVKIFVGNIEEGSSEEKLREKFERFGVVTECTVITKYAFVHMESREEALSAIDYLNGQMFNGRKMNIELATSKGQHGSGRERRHGGGREGGMRHHPYGRPSYPDYEPYGPPRGGPWGPPMPYWDDPYGRMPPRRGYKDDKYGRDRRRDRQEDKGAHESTAEEPATTKKLVNNPEFCVDEALEGFLTMNPGLKQVKGHKVIVRADLAEYKKAKKVAILVGGGSGHDPAFIGYVGHGMATGAVVGNIFAAPTPQSILAGLRALGKDHDAGVLLMLNNYTGDRLNFGIAMERAQAEDIKVASFINSDECSILKKEKSGGKRGLAGLSFLLKIAGAMAEKKTALDKIVSTLEVAHSKMGTMGMCLTACSRPGSGPLFEIDHDSVEIGLGLHGEAGMKTIKMETADTLVGTMLDLMTETVEASKPSPFPIFEGDTLAMLVNNLGATSGMEMNIVCMEAMKYIEKRGVTVARAYCGPFVTSMEMSGISITLMHIDDNLKKWLDADCAVSGWYKPVLVPKGPMERVPPEPLDLGEEEEAELTQDNCIGAQMTEDGGAMLFKAISGVCTGLWKEEKKLNRLDVGCGDADTGVTMRAGVDAVMGAMGSSDAPSMPIRYPYDLLMKLANVTDKSMGGTSGGLYSLFLTAAAGAVKDVTDFNAWCEALGRGTEAIMKHGGAQPGDRSMVDPLHAAYESLKSRDDGAATVEIIQAAVEAAEKATEATAKMKAKVGRAASVSSDKCKQQDAGAYAVSSWMRGAMEVCFPETVVEPKPAPKRSAASKKGEDDSKKTEVKKEVKKEDEEETSMEASS